MLRRSHITQNDHEKTPHAKWGFLISYPLFGSLPDTSLWGDWRSSPPPSQKPLNLTTEQTPIDDHGLVSMDPLSTLSHGFEPYQQYRYSYPYHE